MVAWMIYSIEDYNKNRKYYDMHVEVAANKGIELQLKFMELFSYGVDSSCSYYLKYASETIDKPDFVIGRMRNPLFTKHLELMGIDVYNNSLVARICNDKAKTYQFLVGTGIKVVDTEFVGINELDNKIEQYVEKKDNLNEFIIKSCTGHGGSEVYLASDYPAEHMPQNMVIQPLIKGKNQDVRVYVLDNSIVGAVKRTARSGFRANYSLGGNVDKYDLSVEDKVIVDKIIAWFNKEEYLREKTAGLFYVGIDFIIDEKGKLIFNEIEDVVGSRMLYETSDIDIVEMYLKSILNKYS